MKPRALQRRNWKGRPRSASGNGRGAVQIEFLLSFLTIMFVLFAMWELIMIVHTMNVLSDAAKEGVRYAIVHGTGGLGGTANWDPIPTGCPYAGDNIKCRVWDYARFSLHDISAPSRFNIGVTYNTTPASRVRVDVSYQFVPYTALPLTPTLSASAEGRIVY